jgi:hypothetical protein
MCNYSFIGIEYSTYRPILVRRVPTSIVPCLLSCIFTCRWVFLATIVQTSSCVSGVILESILEFTELGLVFSLFGSGLLFAGHASSSLISTCNLTTGHLKICLLFISLGLYSLQIKFFKISQFTHLSGTLNGSFGSFRELRHLVHTFNIPFAVFKEFVNIFTKHFFKVSVFVTSFSALLLSLFLSCSGDLPSLDIIELLFLQSCFTLLWIHQFRSLGLPSTNS